MEPYHFIKMDEKMEKLKVLFLTYAYPPQKYPRSVQISHLVQYLRKEICLGVVTSCPMGIGDQSLLKFTPFDNVHYAQKSRLTTFIENAKGHRIKKAILPDLSYPWHFDLFKKTEKMVNEFGADVIVTFGQPMSTHIAGLKLKKKFPKLKWVAHFSDPWIDNVFNDDNVWLKMVNKYYQDAVFRYASKLVFTSNETIDLVIKGYSSLTRTKAVFLPHIFDQSIYPIKETLSKTRTPVIIRYLGNFYGNRQPSFLFEALKKIQSCVQENICIEIFCSDKKSVDKEIKKYNLEKFVFAKSAVDYLESLKLMQGADLLLIIDAPMQISPFLPSKLIDYIGANKPIFGITPPGTSQKLIEEMGFLVAHPNNPAQIAEKLSLMIQKINNEQVLAIPEQIRNRYSVETVGKQMINVLKAML